MAEDWGKKLEALAKSGGHDLGRLAKAVKIELFSGVVYDTRVGDPSTWKSKPPPGYTGGRLRGNWQIQENAPTTAPIERIDKEGSAVIEDISSGSTEVGKTYLVNNLPYAKVYEDEDAMIGRNVIRIKKNIRAQIKKIRAGK